MPFARKIYVMALNREGDNSVIIVLINWKIRPDSVDDFLTFWKTEACIKDRSGLVGEFLSEVQSERDCEWINWKLTACDGKYRSFINVGIWSDKEAFCEQVMKYFSKPGEKKRFEYEPRKRVVLTSECWRVGHSVLPCHDSEGTH